MEENMKKINWKEAWEAATEYGNPGMEKWALYLIIFLLVFLYTSWWL